MGRSPPQGRAWASGQPGVGTPCAGLHSHYRDSGTGGNQGDAEATAAGCHTPFQTFLPSLPSLWVTVHKSSHRLDRGGHSPVCHFFPPPMPTCPTSAPNQGPDWLPRPCGSLFSVHRPPSVPGLELPRAWQQGAGSPRGPTEGTPTPGGDPHLNQTQPNEKEAEEAETPLQKAHTPVEGCSANLRTLRELQPKPQGSASPHAKPKQSQAAASAGNRRRSGSPGAAAVGNQPAAPEVLEPPPCNTGRPPGAGRGGGHRPGVPEGKVHLAASKTHIVKPVLVDVAENRDDVSCAKGELRLGKRTRSERRSRTERLSQEGSS